VYAKHDDLAAAGLAPGEIQSEHNVRDSHFYCRAPSDVLVEIATRRKL
jgi:hypothetical protein